VSTLATVATVPDPRQRIAECVGETSLAFVARCLELPAELVAKLASDEPITPDVLAMARFRAQHHLWARAVARPARGAR